MTDLILYLTGSHGIRYTRRQKYKFLKAVIETFSKFGYETKAITERGTHLLLGNMEAAKTIVAVGYDTPSRMFLQSNYYPFEENKNKKEEHKNLLLMASILVVVVFVLFFIVSSYPQLFEPLLNKVILAGLLMLLSVLVRPRANRVNTERYTASLAILFDLASKMYQNKNVAYLLIDQSNTNALGFRILESFKEKEIILLGTLASHPKLIVSGFDTQRLDSFIAKTDLSWSKKLLEENRVIFDKTQKLLYLVGVKEDGSASNTQNSKKVDINIKRLAAISQDIQMYLNEKYRTTVTK